MFSLAWSESQFFYKKIIELGLENFQTNLLSSEYLGLTQNNYDIGLVLKKYLNYLTGLTLILYAGVRLEKNSDYHREFGLILYTGLGL